MTVDLHPYALLQARRDGGPRWHVIGPGVGSAVDCGPGAAGHERATAFAGRLLAIREHSDDFRCAVARISTFNDSPLPCVLTELLALGAGSPLHFDRLSKYERVSAVLQLLRVRFAHAPAIARHSALGLFGEIRFTA